MKVKRKVSEFKEKKAEKSSFLQTIFCFVNHHFKQTVHFKLCDLHWLYDKRRKPVVQVGLLWQLVHNH